jgi:hypothetical protein
VTGAVRMALGVSRVVDRATIHLRDGLGTGSIVGLVAPTRR